MKKEEKLLFKSLCNFKSNKFDEKLLEYATPSVLGLLFFNRMQSIAYGTLKKHGLLNKVNREFRNSLKTAYEKDLEKNQCLFWAIHHVSNILNECHCKYAMLKGAYLCRFYPAGYRTSNDIDLLVFPSDITKIGKALTNAGFKQGFIFNEKFIPATRKEIIEAKMLRGETIPYIKEINLQGMKYLEVDINFSLDYKNSDYSILGEMIDKAENRDVHGLKVPTLNNIDFFIHLCCHLYKEATTLPWIKMKRDMTLYKYCDIYLLLYDMTKYNIKNLFNRAAELGLDKECAFAILQTAELLDIDNEFAIEKAKKILKYDPDFLHSVISPNDNISYVFTEKSIFERFISENRQILLKEKKNEKIENEPQ